MTTPGPTMDENFNNTEDVKNEKVSKKEPTMMKMNRLFDLLSNKNRDTKELSVEEATLARNELCNKNYLQCNFPKQVRANVDPPIDSQNLCMFNFIPSPKCVPDNDGCYGIVKFRGAFSEERHADTWADKIVRKVDSLNTNYYARVGHYFPLLKDGSMYADKNREVNLRKKIDDSVKTNAKNQREQEQQDMDEIKERQNNLLKESSKATVKDNVNNAKFDEESEKQEQKVEEETVVDDLDSYVTLRVKKSHLQARIEDCERIIKESKKALENCRKEITDKDEKHPDFKGKFMDRYRETLEKTGIDINSSPYIKYLISDDETTTLQMDKPVVELKLKK